MRLPGDIRGFTLIELLATLVILGLLAGLAIPKLRDTAEQARIARAIGDIRAVQADVMAFETQNDTVPEPWPRSDGPGCSIPGAGPTCTIPFP